MRFLFNYIRQCFCEHDWIIEESKVDTYGKTGIKVYMRCKKCGYNKKHWKYL